MKHIYLLRHGRTGYSGKYIGSSDVQLSDEGREQIQCLGKKCQQLQVELVICSPMIRCRQSYELLNIDGPVEFDSDLQEIDFGRWEKKSFDEIAANEPQLVNQWASNPGSFTFPEGDAIKDFVNRIKKIHLKIAQIDQKNILIVSHGGVIRLLLCLFLSIPLDKYLLFNVQKGTFSSVELFDNGGVLTGFNIQ